MGEKRKYQRCSREFKMAAVERMQAGESPSALERELGVRRKLLYDWKRRVAEAGLENLRESGAASRRAAGAAAGKAAAERIAELERLVGKQQALIHFFENALQQVEAETAGKAASTKRSGASGRKREQC